MKTTLMMKFLVASETVFFLCLMVSFLFFREFTGYEGIRHLSPKTTGMYSLLLLASSGTYALSERSFRKGNQKAIILWLVVTILLGAIFMYGQGKEYVKLVTKHNITVDEGVFGTNFYTLTGFHSLHVIIGIIALTVCLLMAFAGDFKNKKLVTLRAVGWYWHFVDAVWVVVFTVVYIIPVL